MENRLTLEFEAQTTINKPEYIGKRTNVLPDWIGLITLYLGTRVKK